MKALVTIGQGYGNIVMTTPLITAIASLDYEVDVLVESACAPEGNLLLEGWSVVNRVYKELPKDSRYDVVVRTLWHNGRGLGAGPEVAPEDADLSSTHEVLANMSAAWRMGYSGPVPTQHIQTGDAPEWMHGAIILCPGYGGSNPKDWRRKEWHGWERLARICSAYFGAPPIFLGSSGEMQPWMNEYRHAFGVLTIKEAAGVLMNAKCVVAVDNGLGHIAAALGVPLVSIFTATSLAKNRPWGPNVTIVGRDDLSCRPCQMTDNWYFCKEWKCQDVPIQTVVRAVESCL